MSRNIQFQNDYYYHICNRGVDKRDVFMDQYDYVRFLRCLREFNQIKATGGLYRLYFEQKKEMLDLRNPTPYRESDSEASAKLVTIICYCLNSNHFHLLIQQKKEKGTSDFIKKLLGGYSRYFNNKYKRSGALWQGKYVVREIKSTYDLLKLSIYVNCNAEIHGIAKKENWPWSSYLDYVNLRNGSLCNKAEILENFNNIKEYKIFCEELILEIRENKNLAKWDLE